MGNLKNDSLIKLSLISCIIGIIILYVGSVHLKAEITPISKIDNDFVGLKSKISGQVIGLESHPNGHIFTKVKDESGGVISIPIFSGVKSNLDKKIELLDRIQAKGKIKVYNGELELVPADANKISVINTPSTTVSEVDRSEIGEPLRVRGILEKKTSVGQGNLIITLRDKNGELEVFIPKSVTESKSFPALDTGKPVKACGTVKSYKGNIEIVIDDPYNLVVPEETR